MNADQNGQCEQLPAGATNARAARSTRC
jgi:hypothetical protein